jgi:hypothetical protein
MSDGGKGSNPRPFSVDQKTYDDNWDKIFKKNNYQDVLSTEDCVLDALKEMNRVSDECGDYITNEIDIPKNNPE